MENEERKDKVIFYKRKEVNQDFLTPPPKTRNGRELFIPSWREEKKSNKVERKMKRERIKSSSRRRDKIGWCWMENEERKDKVHRLQEKKKLIEIFWPHKESHHSFNSNTDKAFLSFLLTQRQMWPMGGTTTRSIPLSHWVEEWIFIERRNHCFKPSILVNSAEREKTRQTIKRIKRHSTRPGDRDSTEG